MPVGFVITRAVDDGSGLSRTLSDKLEQKAGKKLFDSCDDPRIVLDNRLHTKYKSG